MSFPLEFSTIKPALRSFLATLFEDNPFQYKPIFRGFYFTSALQEGETNSAAAQRIAHRFGLDSQSLPKPHSAFSKNGFFLRDLFSKVIFADRQTVRQFASPTKTRMRYATFFGFVAALALALGGWTWSTIGNQQLVSNVQADLDNVTRLQQNRNDLQSRLQAMDILEDRIEQLEQFRRDKPLSVSLGLYQGNRLEQHLLTEYYNGVRQILLAPVSDNLASFLKDVNAHPDQLAPMTRAPESGATPAGPMPVSTHPAAPGAALPAVAQGRQQGGLYNDASPTNVEDAYNALKTYLMLSDKRHVEQAHLTDQVARFWRGWLETNRGNMPRDEMIRSAERMITFYLSRVSDNDWPMIEANLALVDQTRENLRRVVRGMPARQRVYEEIKARASTRFAPMTIARIVGEGNTGLVAGSYAIPGTFTRDAWFQYVQPAIRDAATKELQAKDWVLNTASADDLTLEGSPEQIQKTLVAMYKTEYAQHWQKFMQGIAVQGFGNFTQAVDAMNKLGDPQDSPIRKVLETAYDQTSWDNPSLANATIKKAQTGVVNWVKQWFTRQPGGQIAANVDINGNPADVPMGPIGQEFVGLGRIVATHDGTSMLKGYMDTLSKVRTRFNVIKNQGDPGPGARQLMQQTLDGNGSELADSLKFVDEQMLTGLTDSQRKSLRPLLVRPLMQAFAVVIQPASVEVNKVWNAQVYQPFQNSLANKYPFAAGAKVEAGAGEIAQVFGPDGSIAKFVGTTLGPLAVRRGDTLSARTWGDMGLALTPDFTGGFARWVAPLAGGAATSAAASSEPQTVFQVLPQPSSGTTEYTIAIDGQQLRYRNTPPQWTNFVWPNPQGSPGATLSATTFDGRTLQLVNEPGRYGLEKLINSAQRKRRPDGTFDLTWTQGSVSVSVTMRIISTSQPTGGGDQPQQQSLRGLRLPSSVADASAGGAANATAQPGSGAAAAQVAATAASASNAQGRNDANGPGPDRLLRQDPVARRLREERAQPAVAANARPLDRARDGAPRRRPALEDRLRKRETDALRVSRLEEPASDRGPHDREPRRVEPALPVPRRDGARSRSPAHVPRAQPACVRAALVARRRADAVAPRPAGAARRAAGARRHASADRHGRPGQRARRHVQRFRRTPDPVRPRADAARERPSGEAARRDARARLAAAPGDAKRHVAHRARPHAAAADRSVLPEPRRRILARTRRAVRVARRFRARDLHRHDRRARAAHHRLQRRVRENPA